MTLCKIATVKDCATCNRWPRIDDQTSQYIGVCRACVYNPDLTAGVMVGKKVVITDCWLPIPEAEK